MSIQNVKMISVLIVDDHPVLRAGIRTLLEKSPDMFVIGETGDGKEAEKLLDELRPNIVLLDLKIPNFSPFTFEKWARTKYPETITLVFTAHDCDAYLVGMMDVGAAGFLSKTEAEERLVGAIRCAVSGTSLFTEEQFSRAHRWRQDAGKKWESLTERELQVLRLLAREGCDNKCIAERLGITAKTAGFHISNILEKLDVRSRQEAVAWVHKYLPDSLEIFPG